MSMFARILGVAKTPVFTVCGIAVQYVPRVGDAKDVRVIRRPPGIDQPSADTYFADVEINPAEVPAPRAKDEVVWEDGRRFVVVGVRWPANENPVLVLHKKPGQA